MWSARYSCEIFKNLNILYTFSRNNETSNVMRTCPVEADLFLADGQTDMTSLMGACRNFANAPTNGRWIQRVLLNYMLWHIKKTTVLILCHLKTSWAHKIKCLCVSFCFWEDSAALRTPRSSRWTIRRASENASKRWIRNVSIPQGQTKQHSFIHSFSILSDDRSEASSKTMPPHSAI